MKHEEVLLEIPRADDFHVHLRQGKELTLYTKDLVRCFGRAMAMPNTLPPIRTPQELSSYLDRIRQAATAAGRQDFQPLGTFKIAPSIDPADVEVLSKAGAIAGKLYPQGATTNSEDGVSEIRELYPLFEAMQDAGVVLSVHGEDPSVTSFEREAAFLPKIDEITSKFPRLRIVLEHISTRQSLEFLEQAPDNIAATVTVQHIANTIDDLLGGHLRPHLFCKPVLKAPEHSAAIRRAVLSGHPRLFFGSDSAPHAASAKECDCGCAGVYSAPVALEVLAEIFDEAGELQKLPEFVGGRGADFYGLPRRSGPAELRIVRRPWKVPGRYGDVVPYRAGEELSISIEEIRK